MSLRLIRSKDQSFLQLLPGCLDMANNLYRFCVNIEGNPKVIDGLLRALQSQMNDLLINDRVEEFPLNDESCRKLVRLCSEELVEFLHIRGVGHAQIGDYQPKIIQTIPVSEHDEARRIIEDIRDCAAKRLTAARCPAL